MSKDTYDAHHEAARRIFEQLVYLEQSEEADKGLQTQLLHEMFEHREAQRAADPERFERDQAAAISGFFRQSDDVEPATRH